MVAAVGVLTWCGICLWPRTRQKPKMDIVLTKSPDFDDIIAQESQATGPSAGDDMATQLEGNQSLALLACSVAWPSICLTCPNGHC